MKNELYQLYGNLSLYELEESFSSCCFNGKLEDIKYILLSNELKENVDLTKYDYYWLTQACSMGHIDVVRYMLTSSDLKNHAKISANGKQKPFLEACSQGHIEIVKYLVSSTELNIHADIHTEQDKPFRTICGNGHHDILEYLIFDYKIPKTQHIENYIKVLNRTDVQAMFEKRDLNDVLEKELHSDNIYKNKIKL